MWYDLQNNEKISQISLDERVIAYGDGFFSTMAVVNGEINWQNYHQKRCETACQALQLDIDIDNIFQNLQSFAKQLLQGILKIIICRQSQHIRGYGFDNGLANIWLKYMPSEKPLATSSNQLIMQPTAQAVCLQQKIAVQPPPLAGLKLLNAQDKALAHAELLQYQAKNQQIIEGLVQDMAGNWVEGTFCNIFYQLNQQNQWFTPPIYQSGVAGVMRQVVLDKFLPNALERNLQDIDLTHISALFFCNAVRGVIPISRLTLPMGQQIDFTTDFYKKFA